MQRRYDLDWLRVMAFALLMLFHTGMMFSTWDWHIKNLETSQTFDLVMRFLHQWRMPLLFFISGSAVWFAMDRYSTWRYFKERQKRLLLPLIFGMLVVIPPQVYVERLYAHQQYDSFWDFYRTVFTTGPYPQGNLSWHHLWYVPYIWVYSMLTLPFFLLLRSAGGRGLLERCFGWLSRPWCLFLVFLPSAISDILVRPFFPGDQMNLIADWGNFCHKLTFFIAGFALASGVGVYDAIARHRRKFLTAGILSLLVLEPIWLSDWHVPHSLIAVYRMLHNFNIWMWILAVLGFGRHYLSFNHPALRYANEAVYPFYILHQTVIVILGYQVVYSNWSIPLKFLVVATGTFLVTWLLYAFVIKPSNLLRVAFGMKPVSRRAESDRRRPTTQTSAPARPVPAFVRDVAATELKLERTAQPRSRRGWLLWLGLTMICLSGCSRPHGHLLSCQISPLTLVTNCLGIAAAQRVAVYLPPSYQQGDDRYPVLYLLPNFKHDLWRYTGGSFQGFRLKDAMDRQIREGRVQEMIVVLPNANHWLGGSWYLNSPLTGGWADYISKDLVGYVDSHFRTIPVPASRAIAGHGMGGIGALDLALQHAEVFGPVYALSPALFDARGMEDLGVLKDSMLRLWQTNLSKWAHLQPDGARRSFRDFIQTRLNSPVRQAFMEGLCISYAAAVSPDLNLPYPHIAFPSPGMSGPRAKELARKFEGGFGDWQRKLKEYLAKGRSLPAITVEYGGDGEYEWIRQGAVYVSNLMRSMGIPNTLEIHGGGHDGRLGERLETAMLPAVSRSLKGEQ